MNADANELPPVPEDELLRTHAHKIHATDQLNTINHPLSTIRSFDETTPRSSEEKENPTGH